LDAKTTKKPDMRAFDAGIREVLMRHGISQEGAEALVRDSFRSGPVESGLRPAKQPVTDKK
jgi:hypothetical protein